MIPFSLDQIKVIISEVYIFKHQPFKETQAEMVKLFVVHQKCFTPKGSIFFISLVDHYVCVWVLSTIFVLRYLNYETFNPSHSIENILVFYSF